MVKPCTKTFGGNSYMHILMMHLRTFMTVLCINITWYSFQLLELFEYTGVKFSGSYGQDELVTWKFKEG